jgi:hypothetical protein
MLSDTRNVDDARSAANHFLIISGINTVGCLYLFGLSSVAMSTSTTRPAALCFRANRVFTLY